MTIILPAPRPTIENGHLTGPPCPRWCADEPGHDLFAVDGVITRLHVGPSIAVGDLAVGLDALETIEPGVEPHLGDPTVTLSGPAVHHGTTELTPAAAAALAAALTTASSLAVRSGVQGSTIGGATC